MARRNHGRMGALRVAGGVARLAYRHRHAIVRGAQGAVRRFRNARHPMNKKRRMAHKGGTNKKQRRGGELSTDMGSGAEYTKMRMKYGKGRGNPSVRKLVRTTTNRTSYRFQAINPYYNISVAPINGLTSVTAVGGGAYYLWNNNATDTLIQTCPLILFDITSQINSNNGITQYPNVAYQLNFGMSTAGVGGRPLTQAWTVLPTDLADTTGLGSTWQIENSTAAATSTIVPRRKTIIKNVYAKLLTYGATNSATKFKISLIQLKQDYMHPLESNTSIPTDDEKNTNIGFWEYMTKQQIAHPLDVLDSRYKRFVKVLKTQEFITQPRLTTESDANIGHMKELNFFMPINRTCTYDWEMNNNGIGQNDKLLNFNTFQSNISSLSTYVVPKARIYMMVQATNVQVLSGTTAVPYVGPPLPKDTTPSFDIVLRKSILDLSH